MKKMTELLYEAEERLDADLILQLFSDGSGCVICPSQYKELDEMILEFYGFEDYKNKIEKLKLVTTIK